MTWNAFHHRAEVLRAVIGEADARLDGVLPMETPGVAEIFGDEIGLIGALQLRWHTHLAGMIEAELMDQSMDLESAVTSAWHKTATELHGIRAILDAYTDVPTSEAIAEALTKAHRKDWALMAAMAGKTSVQDQRAAAIGRGIEEHARAAYQPTAGGRHRFEDANARTSAGTPHGSLLGRIRAHIAA